MSKKEEKEGRREKSGVERWKEGERKERRKT